MTFKLSFQESDRSIQGDLLPSLLLSKAALNTSDAHLPNLAAQDGLKVSSTIFIFKSIITLCT
jgi:hypothetical protein